MTALVEYQVRSDETTVYEWLKEWQKRAQDALYGESQTTTYASAASLEDESYLFFYEHYENGSRGPEVPSGAAIPCSSKRDYGGPQNDKAPDHGHRIL